MTRPRPCAGCDLNRSPTPGASSATTAWRRRFNEPRECPSCSRVITVNARGYCRLCTRQAALIRLPHCSIDVAEACRHGWGRQLQAVTRSALRVLLATQDIPGALPAQADQHRQALTAIRSLFRFLKGRRVTFADPAARLRHDRPHNGQPLPLNLDPVREAIHSTQPAPGASSAGRLPSPAQRPARQPEAHRRARRAAPPGRGGSSRWPVPSASGWRPGWMSAPAAGPLPSTRTC